MRRLIASPHVLQSILTSLVDVTRGDRRGVSSKRGVHGYLRLGAIVWIKLVLKDINLFTLVAERKACFLTDVYNGIGDSAMIFRTLYDERFYCRVSAVYRVQIARVHTWPSCAVVGSLSS